MGEETGKGARYLGGDTFIANGERFRDPRGL